MLTRLEKTLYRLEAQHACLQWAFEQTANQDGIVFEIGLGLGRTFNHMRHRLADREIYAFERIINAYPDCMPDEAHLIMGEIEETLPAAAERFVGQVVLAHSDIGSFDKANNRTMAGLIS
ncbi:MAG: class I SAM-dependent methyltransferase, partial [Aestuariivirgaceae bacterium]